MQRQFSTAYACPLTRAVCDWRFVCVCVCVCACVRTCACVYVCQLERDAGQNPEVSRGLPRVQAHGLSEVPPPPQHTHTLKHSKGPFPRSLYTLSHAHTPTIATTHTCKRMAFPRSLCSKCRARGVWSPPPHLPTHTYIFKRVASQAYIPLPTSLPPGASPPETLPPRESPQHIDPP